MKKAVCIGINDYPEAPLNFCVNDARELHSLLLRNGDDSPNFDSKFVSNIATKAELRRIIIDVFSGNNEIALFYFSGHGYVNSFGGYIVTPDAEEYDEGVSMIDLLNIANASISGNKIIILDCCYSGNIGNPSINGGISGQITNGLTIMTSCMDNEAAIEVDGHGIYTNLLLEALKGGAADLNGYITSGSIYSYIDRSLGAWYQRPVFKTNITAFSPVRRIRPQVPEEVLREIKDLFPSPDYEYRLDPSFEDTNDPECVHTIIQPYANPENTVIFKKLQKFFSVGLVVPIGEEYMYFAAMRSKACRLTPLGKHYWKLATRNKL